jgi:hypothetical protein
MFVFLVIGLSLTGIAIAARIKWARTPEPPPGAFSEFEIYMFKMRQYNALTTIPYVIGFGVLLALASIASVVFAHRPMF